MSIEGIRIKLHAHPKKVELEDLADLSLCAKCLIFKLHFSYLLNRRLRGCLHDGRRDDIMY
jgi:hypothetical protein